MSNSAQLFYLYIEHGKMCQTTVECIKMLKKLNKFGTNSFLYGEKILLRLLR